MIDGFFSNTIAYISIVRYVFDKPESIYKNYIVIYHIIMLKSAGIHKQLFFLNSCRYKYYKSVSKMSL